MPADKKSAAPKKGAEKEAKVDDKKPKVYRIYVFYFDLGKSVVISSMLR